MMKVSLYLICSLFVSKLNILQQTKKLVHETYELWQRYSAKVRNCMCLLGLLAIHGYIGRV